MRSGDFFSLIYRRCTIRMQSDFPGFPLLLSRARDLLVHPSVPFPFTLLPSLTSCPQNQSLLCTSCVLNRSTERNTMGFNAPSDLNANDRPDRRT